MVAQHLFGVCFILLILQLYQNEAHWNIFVKEKFTSSGLVPDLIPIAPDKKVEVFYLSSRKAVNFGNILKPSQVRDIPTINYHVWGKKCYTLAMLDPDAPSRQNPFEKAFVHWLVGNIPGTNVGQGDTLAEYIGSAPPENSGFHRYAFLVYEQTCKIRFNETILTTTSFEERKSFSIETFSKKYDLGNPVMGNYFLAEHEN